MTMRDAVVAVFGGASISPSASIRKFPGDTFTTAIGSRSLMTTLTPFGKTRDTAANLTKGNFSIFCRMSGRSAFQTPLFCVSAATIRRISSVDARSTPATSTGFHFEKVRCRNGLIPKDYQSAAAITAKMPKLRTPGKKYRVNPIWPGLPDTRARTAGRPFVAVVDLLFLSLSLPSV